jgi:hypothetical protein
MRNFKIAAVVVALALTLMTGCGKKATPTSREGSTTISVTTTAVSVTTTSPAVTAPPTTAAPATTSAPPTTNAAPATTQAPVASQAPAAGGPGGATARCNDGTYSYAANHQGACSRHGGVAQFYN